MNLDHSATSQCSWIITSKNPSNRVMLYIPMLCAFLSRRLKMFLLISYNFLVTSYGFFFPPRTPHPRAFWFLRLQMFCLYILNTGYHIFSRSSTKEMASPWRHPQYDPLITQLQLGRWPCLGLRIISNPSTTPKIENALVSFWPESTTSYREFCHPEHVPDLIFSKQ